MKEFLTPHYFWYVYILSKKTAKMWSNTIKLFGF